MTDKNAKTYKIISLISENVKRLKAVSITPEGNVVEITGKNGAGKSSLLDSIFFALSGTSEIPSMPIRKGEDKARITIDLGSLTITRRFNAKEDGGFTTVQCWIETVNGDRPGAIIIEDGSIQEQALEAAE